MTAAIVILFVFQKQDDEELGCDRRHRRCHGGRGVRPLGSKRRQEEKEARYCKMCTSGAPVYFRYPKGGWYFRSRAACDLSSFTLQENLNF